MKTLKHIILSILFGSLSTAQNMPPIPPVTSTNITAAFIPNGSVSTVVVTNWSDFAPTEGIENYPIMEMPKAGDRYEMDFGTIVTNRIVTLVIDGRIEQPVISRSTNTQFCVVRRHRLVRQPMTNGITLVRRGLPRHR